MLNVIGFACAMLFSMAKGCLNEIVFRSVMPIMSDNGFVPQRIIVWIELNSHSSRLMGEKSYNSIRSTRNVKREMKKRKTKLLNIVCEKF